MKRRIRIRTVLTAALLLGLGLGGLAWSGAGLRLSDTGNADRSGNLSLTLRHITIAGQANSDPGRLEDILDGLRDRQVFRTDLEAAQDKVMALPWIADAALAVQLPDRLQLTLREREAFAVWQHDGQRYLVDRTGYILMSDPPRRWRDLPLVIGDGAATAAAGLLEQLDALPEIDHHLQSATYVAGRRWTLHLDNGIAVALPEDGWPDAAYGLSEALDRLSALEARYKIGGRAISRIDLRFANRIILHRLPGTVIAETRQEHST